mmetsp:Transcript_24523/g.62284  ORF Transcript_24523/g.62284 Transcript_24523/m.62284 type:complete len:330 (-) Transcript_24523:830-1819(-)
MLGLFTSCACHFGTAHHHIPRGWVFAWVQCSLSFLIVITISINTNLLGNHTREQLYHDHEHGTAVASPMLAARVLAQERMGKGRRIIAMSLYGDNPRYTMGAIENAVVVLRSWHGWTLRIYHDDTVPSNVLHILVTLHVELKHIYRRGQGAIGMMWRFLIAADRTVSRFIVRDADSRLTLRDFNAVCEWIGTNFYFHCMRDHPYHGASIMGGMWGSLGGFLNPSSINAYLGLHNKSSWGEDQDFLSQVLFKAVANYTLQHACYHCDSFDFNLTVAFRDERLSAYDFVGSVHDQWDPYYIGMRCDAPCECGRRGIGMYDLCTSRGGVKPK